MVKTVSTTAMPPSRLPSTRPISVQVGPKAFLKRMPPQHRAFGQALGAGMGDVVEPQHLQRAGARHADRITPISCRNSVMIGMTM